MKIELEIRKKWFRDKWAVSAKIANSQLQLFVGSMDAAVNERDRICNNCNTLNYIGQELICEFLPSSNIRG